MIRKFAAFLGISKEEPKKEVETQTTILQKKAGTYKEPKKEEGEAFKQDALNYYTGIPAPAYLDDDPWFGPAPVRSEKQLDYMEHETQMKQQEEAIRSEFTVESEDIHAKMYEIATASNGTAVQRDPIGGSENFQGGSNGYGWMSGTGMGQFH